jgi:large subunit ribosomal protein L18
MANKRIISARRKRVRKNIRGTAQKPRLTVFRSNMYIYAQLIDDQNSKTITSMSDKKLPSVSTSKTKVEKAANVGELLATEALKNKITKVVFDRGSYKYHGRVKALAEAARKGGLNF